MTMDDCETTPEPGLDAANHELTPNAEATQLEPPDFGSANDAEISAAALRAENRALAERLRTALLAGDPAVAPELVHGETVAEIEASYAVAKEVAERMRETFRREAAVSAAIPAGAPGRLHAHPRTPIDKIRAGLSSPAGSGGTAPGTGG